jgi:outer membrane protein OmpA-like peptidoglycan-associated protein
MLAALRDETWLTQRAAGDGHTCPDRTPRRDMDFQFSRFEIMTGAGSLFLCLVFVCLFMEASAIQTQIGTAAMAAVEREDLFWVSVEGRGQGLVLSGAAPDRMARERAGEIASGIPGVSTVDNRIAVIGEAGTCQHQMDDYLKDRRVTFKTGRIELSSASLPVLAMVAGIARGCGAAFEVASHTDAEGDSAINHTLSQRRAEAVVRYLVQSGVHPDQLRAVGYGEAQPVADNGTEAGRTANRRVEFRIVGGDA